MEITLIWSWFSFFIGIGASFFLGLGAIISIAYKQYKKQKQTKSQVEELFGDLLGDKSK